MWPQCMYYTFKDTPNFLYRDTDLNLHSNILLLFFRKHESCNAWSNSIEMQAKPLDQIHVGIGSALLSKCQGRNPVKWVPLGTTPSSYGGRLFPTICCSKSVHSCISCKQGSSNPSLIPPLQTAHRIPTTKLHNYRRWWRQYWST